MKLPREEMANYCIEVPVNTTQYFVDDEEKDIVFTGPTGKNA